MTLVCGRVLHPYLHPRIRRKFAKRLAKLGVTVIDGPGAKVTAVSRDAVQLDDGRELPSAVTIWTAGLQRPRPGRPQRADAPTRPAASSPTRRSPASTTTASSRLATRPRRRICRCG